MMIKDDKGITLITLIITIIVVMILASISVYSGVSTVKYTKLMKAKAQMETMQTMVNSWYDDYKNGNVDVLSYGTKEDFYKYSNVFETLGIENTDNYRVFSYNYINETLGIEGISYDFLISVLDREVILAHRITYDKKAYYTLEDFGIENVQINPISSVDFSVDYNYNWEISGIANIWVYDVIFKDTENRNVDINKYKIQYKKSDWEIWKTINSYDTTEYIAENGETYDAYKISVDSIGEYQIKVSSNDDTVSNERVLELKLVAE